jgi:signal transduction histidine kinase
MLVLAPIGRDGPASVDLLRRIGLSAELCTGLADLIDKIEAGAAAVFVAEEGLFGKDISSLTDWVERQPPWSDLPFVVLTSQQAHPAVAAWRQRLTEALRNISFLERPVQAITLTSSMQAALRARSRQYEVRSLLEARERAAQELEALVAARTTELEAANAELRRQMAERMRAEEALRQSQKMEAVGQLTGGLAHDFNNLLAGISGSLELLQARISQGRIKDLGRYIIAAQGAAARAAAITHRLLAFSRRQTLDPRPTDANRLIVSMEELIRRTAGPAIAVEIVLAAGLWPVLCDSNQLENALLNLCINAHDAMPDGGRLTIETANTWVDERAARERDMAPGQYVALCVSDTGTGMTPEVIARAFDPFFTTKPIGQGTGLGLSMIYGFARQSGGQVRIYSELGEGTTMRLYLPRHHGKVEGEELSPELAEAPRAEAGETVLIVDDEPTVRMLVTEVLEDLGYTAIEAADGAAGLHVLQSSARIDLLITDVGLPGGMNGRQVADAARQARPDLKVLFITGYAENAVLSHGHLESGMHVLTKPFALEALASRIRDLISDG